MGRYYKGQGGRPFQIRGDAAWAALVQLTLAQWESYLDTRKSQGFNLVILTLFEVEFNGNTNAAIGQDVTGLTPFTATLAGGKADFTTPRTAYWDRASSFIKAARKRGMLVLGFPIYLGYARTEGCYATVVDNGSSRVSSYGTFFGGWAQQHDNLIVAIGGDISQNSSPSMEASVYSLLDDFCDAMRAADVNTRIVTGHFFAPTTRTTEEPVPGGQDRGNWEDLNFVYKYDAVHQACENAYAVSGPIPCILGECRYDQHSSNPTRKLLRAQYYHGLTSGCHAGVIHGHEGVWGFGMGLYEDANPWTVHVNDASAADFTKFVNFCKAIAWWTLVPDTTSTLVTAGRGTVNTHDYVTAAKDAAGTLAVVVIRAGGQVTIDMSEFSGLVTAQWYDPVSGTYSLEAGTQPFTNSGSRNFDPAVNSAGDTDMVLLLTA